MTAGTEEDVEEILEAALWMEVDGEGEGEGEERDDWTQKSLGALQLLNQDAELIGTTLVYARNGFTELSRLAMLWTVRHHWTAGARFAFN